MESEVLEQQAVPELCEVMAALEEVRKGTGIYPQYLAQKEAIEKEKQELGESPSASAIWTEQNENKLVAAMPIDDLDRLYGMAAEVFEYHQEQAQHYYERLWQETGGYSASDVAEMTFAEAEAFQKRRTFLEQQLQHHSSLSKTAYEVLSHIQQLVERKEAIERSLVRSDRSYVVEMAQIKCTMGLRRSVILLPDPPYVFVKGIAVMTVADIIPDHHVINFGGCTSHDNEALHQTAQQLIDRLRAQYGYTVRAEDTSKRTDLLNMCACPCKPVFLKDWNQGQERVLINGHNPLLKQSVLHCANGGIITFRLSGQK